MNPLLDKHENLLLTFIKYGPIIFVSILLLLVMVFLEREHKNNLNSQIEKTSELYKKFHTVETKEEVDKLYQYISFVEENSSKMLRENIKRKVYEAHRIAHVIYEKNKKTKSKAEITELIKESLRAIRFNNGRGYYFIYEKSGKNIMHGANIKLENKNFWNYQDIKGTFLLQEMNQILENHDETFFTWYWYKPNDQNKEYEKLGFFKEFTPYNWFIGTGEYTQDFTQQLQEQTLQYIQNTNVKKEKYIFIIDYDGNTLAHVNEKLINVNHMETKDKEDFPFIKAFIDKAKEGEGFITYYLPFNNTKYKKTSFIKGFNKWQWVIGNGYNNQSLELLIEDKIEEYKLQENERYKAILTTVFILAICLLLLSIYVSYILKRKFLEYKVQLQEEELATTNQRIQTQKIYKDLFENAEVSIWNEDFSYIYEYFETLKDKGISNIEDYFVNHPEMVVTLAQSVVVKEVNHATLRLFNSTSSQKFIKNIHETFGSNAIDIFKKELIAIWRRDETFRSEANFKTFEGDELTAIISFQIPKSTKEAKSIPVTILDITEVKRKDNLLYQQSKMASMGEMIGNIAHQWRQPLSIISTISSGIRFQKEYNQLSDEELFKSMDNIHDASKHLSETIEDFRNFFSIQKEKISFSLLLLIKRTISLTSAQFKNHEIDIINRVDDITLNTYENELVQVVMNIINNARDAFFHQDMKERKIILIDSVIENGFVSLCIQDSAGGVPETIINRIFEPYFTTKDKSQGTGIGLYMSEEIIVKHMFGELAVVNKTFEFEGQTYKGAKFTIKLPIQ